MKRTLILLVTMLLLVFSFTGCDKTSTNETDAAAAQMPNFKVIEGKEYLSYNKDTRVVYYMFSTSSSFGNIGYGYTYFAPYISENGNFCKYINDEIVEITAN